MKRMNMKKRKQGTENANETGKSMPSYIPKLSEIMETDFPLESSATSSTRSSPVSKSVGSERKTIIEPSPPAPKSKRKLLV